MLTIVGNGMGGYSFKNLPIDIEEFDKIVCDRNFEESGDNILKLSFKDAKEYILENYNKEDILYVVTGSPLFFSAGTLLASKLPKDMVKIIDNTSSKSYLLSKLAISENVVESISLHGRAKLDLDSLFRKRYTLIYNSYKDKNYSEILSILQPIVSEIEIIDVDDARVTPPDAMKACVKELGYRYKKYSGIDDSENYLVFGSFSVVESFLKVNDE